MAFGSSIRTAWLFQYSNLGRNVNHEDVAIRTVVTDMDTVWSPELALTYQRAPVSSIYELYWKYQGGILDEIEGIHAFSAPALDVLFRNHDRRLFINKRGHLGLGPAAMQLGDSVVVIRSAKLPMVVRQDSNGQSALFGEA